MTKRPRNSENLEQKKKDNKKEKIRGIMCSISKVPER